jgi:hypothetical protein
MLWEWLDLANAPNVFRLVDNAFGLKNMVASTPVASNNRREHIIGATT